MSRRAYKKVVHERDNETCQECGGHGGKGNPLTVHHKKPKCQYPELASDPDNCVLLCWKCHTALHKREGYPQPFDKER